MKIRNIVLLSLVLSLTFCACRQVRIGDSYQQVCDDNNSYNTFGTNSFRTPSASTFEQTRYGSQPNYFGQPRLGSQSGYSFPQNNNYRHRYPTFDTQVHTSNQIDEGFGNTDRSSSIFNRDNRFEDSNIIQRPGGYQFNFDRNNDHQFDTNNRNFDQGNTLHALNNYDLIQHQTADGTNLRSENRLDENARASHLNLDQQDSRDSGHDRQTIRDFVGPNYRAHSQNSDNARQGGADSIFLNNSDRGEDFSTSSAYTVQRPNGGLLDTRSANENHSAGTDFDLNLSNSDFATQSTSDVSSQSGPGFQSSHSSTSNSDNQSANDQAQHADSDSIASASSSSTRQDDGCGNFSQQSSNQSNNQDSQNESSSTSNSFSNNFNTATNTATQQFDIPRPHYEPPCTTIPPPTRTCKYGQDSFGRCKPSPFCLYSCDQYGECQAPHCYNCKNGCDCDNKCIPEGRHCDSKGHVY